MLNIVETHSTTTAPTTTMDAIQRKHRQKTQTAGFGPKTLNSQLQSHDRKR